MDRITRLTADVLQQGIQNHQLVVISLLKGQTVDMFT
jgi:hypothetical protein